MTEMSENHVIFEEVSPYGALMAVVEDDGEAMYVHIVAPEGSDIATRSLWLRNRRPAPMGFEEGWEEGARGPALPFDACVHPAGLPAPRPDALNVVWFPEGDALAVRDGEAVLGVIPPWAGAEGCPGYARDCRSQTPVAWPLGKPEGNPLYARLDSAMAFWDDWQRGAPWAAVQAALIASYDAAFGPHRRYFSIDAGQWPPRFIAECVSDSAITYVTGGMSVRPQPRVDRYFAHPEEVRHVELAWRQSDLTLEPPTAPLNQMSQLCTMPWHMDAWLASGHTVPAKGVPVGPSGTTFPAFLVHAAPPEAPGAELPRYRGEPVNVLWLIAITPEEREFAIAQGSEALIERLFSGGVTATHRDRASVV